MIDYMKFWLAKMLAELLPLVLIFAAFLFVVAYMVVQDKLKRIFKRGTSGKGSEGRG